MKFWYRFVCAFVAVAVVLFSVRVPDVDALTFNDDDYKYKPSMVSDGTKRLFIYDDTTYDFLQNYDIDDYYRVDGQKEAYELIVADAEDGNILGYNFPDSNDILIRIYRDFTNNYWVLEYADDSSLYLHYRPDEGILNFKCDYIRQFKFIVENGEIKPVVLQFYGERDLDVLIETGVNTVMFPFFEKYLNFTVTPDFSDDMDMNNLNTNFTIDVENETDNAYNYCIYISSQPASVGIVNSLQSANYFLSSKQWCYVFQQDYQLDSDLLDQIKNNVSDNYTTTDIIDYMLKGAPITNLTNVWGGVYNGAKEYIALKNNSMSFYSLVQTNCPVYLIRSDSTRSHVVDYASLNVNLDTQYYLNIIYYQPDMNVVGAIGSSTAALVSAATGEDMIYPIYNVDFFRDYTVYDSIPFSFVNGTFSISEDDVTKYNDVVQNSNPANSTANISSDDDNVNINNSNSYDSSVKTNYYNYGTIYHNCSWSSGSGGSSGARPSVPELPEAEFENLYEQSGNFFDFVADVLDSVGAVPALFIAAAFAVLLFLRIWGR